MGVCSRTLGPRLATNRLRSSLRVSRMCTTQGEAGLDSLGLINNVVFVGTTKPGFYAFSVEAGLPLWSADIWVFPFGRATSSALQLSVTTWWSALRRVGLPGCTRLFLTRRV